MSRASKSRPKPASSPPGRPEAGTAGSSNLVSIRELARRLGISHSTVSRALHDDSRVSAAVRARVRALALELDYRPDPMLSALVHYRHLRHRRAVQAELAWINGWTSPGRLRSFREFELYWRGAEDEAARAGFRLTEFRLDARMSAARLGSILEARGVRGLLIPPHGGVVLDWTGFPWEKFSVVRFGYSLPEPRSHVVSGSQLHNGALAFRQAWEKGYRRIGLVISDRVTTHFSAGYLEAQMATFPAATLPPHTFDPGDESGALRRLEGWLRAHEPDAILTDRRELRALLARIGRRVPEETGLATFSVHDAGADFGIDAGIDQNSEEIGRNGLRLLLSLILHHERGLPANAHELLIDGRWVDGASLPPKHSPNSGTKRG